MKFPILASFLVFIIIVAIFNKRTTRLHKKRSEDFWKREREANFVRKKSLDDLEYISIPFSSFPMDIAKDDEIIASCHRDLESLRDEKIVNFTGYSNTDLKLAYGTANITVLTQYDQNYTLFVRALQEFGKRLYELGYHDEALIVLEYAISTRTDISATYYLLASIYHEKGQTGKIKHLIFVADTLQSAMKGPIVRTLKESYPDIG
jgi:tetratricopeptide (TPR) repeat protein